MKTKKRYVVFALAISVIAVFMMGCTQELRQEAGRSGSGRSWQTSEAGPVESFEGSLSYKDPEWFLETETEKIQLGLGNPSYLESTGLKLEEGMMVSVTGHVLDDELSVFKLIADGEEVVIRTDDGAPMWAGKGRLAEDRGGNGDSDSERSGERPSTGRGQNSGNGGGGAGDGRRNSQDSGGRQGT